MIRNRIFKETMGYCMKQIFKVTQHGSVLKMSE